MANQGFVRRLLIDRRTTVLALVGAALLGFALWVFAEMVDDTPKGEFRSWDEPLLRWVRGEPGSLRSTQAIVWLARGVTQLGSAPVLAVVVAAALVWLVSRRRWRTAIVLAVVALGSLMITNMLKHHFARARPDIVPHLVNEESWSFPSGHALSSAAIYLTLGLILASVQSGGAKQAALVGGGFLLSFLIGLSRIYLGVHYPTDVLAGWSAGTVWALTCSALLISKPR